jgi:hypothetical protein
MAAWKMWKRMRAAIAMPAFSTADGAVRIVKITKSRLFNLPPEPFGHCG